MDRKTLRNLPSNYAVCILADCPMASQCLRHVAFDEMAERNDFMRVISPCVCSKNEKCKHYRSAQPLTFALGFTNMQKRMYPDQYKRFVNLLMQDHGRTTFYKKRKGTKPLHPKEQAKILSILRRIGITEELKFDRYEEMYDTSD